VTFDVGFTVNRMGKPALDCHFAIPRILGTVASLAADASVSSMIAHSFDIRYALPGLFAGNWKLVVEAVKQVNDYHYASSFSEGVSGIGMGLIKGNHRIGLDAHLRDIYPLVTLQGSKLVASEEIRRMPLRSVKTSLSYNWIVDRTIGNPHAVGGYKFVLNCESSGVFGDVRMTKLTSMFQFNRQLFRSITLHTRLASGAISQFGSGKTPIQDRFFLGGTADETSTCLCEKFVRSVRIWNGGIVFLFFALIFVSEQPAVILPPPRRSVMANKLRWDDATGLVVRITEGTLVPPGPVLVCPFALRLGKKKRSEKKYSPIAKNVQNFGIYRPSINSVSLHTGP
jgi:hypothetical protein